MITLVFSVLHDCMFLHFVFNIIRLNFTQLGNRKTQGELYQN